MKLRILLLAAGCALMIGCGHKNPTTTAPSTNSPAGPVISGTAGPLPDSGFKAQISLPEPPAKLRAGQREVITVKVKNISNVVWWLRGGQTNDRPDNKFYIALGNHWLDKDGKPTKEIEGHNGIPKDLRPGEEVEMTLQITAPKQAGDYILEVDMVQEAVSWFGDKGSPTAKVKVTVV